MENKNVVLFFAGDLIGTWTATYGIEAGFGFWEIIFITVISCGIIGWCIGYFTDPKRILHG